MIGKIPLLGCVLLIAIPAAAQTQLGIRTGIGVNSVSPEYDESITRIIAAADVTLPLYGLLGIRVGAAYAPRGGRRSNPNMPDTGFGDGTPRGTRYANAAHPQNVLVMSYAQLSALLHASLETQAGLVEFGMVGGPWFGLITWCSYRNDPCADRGRDFESYDYGLALGGGVALAVSDDVDLALELIHFFGMADIRSERGRATTSHLAGQIGFVFEIG
ncbi:hypothetical protein [Candidatus Palauibacter sp.]|uniref:hypothetical protein n=1 Tax=Candidatus Palauibacter sp. TaxID=3101350 RepID=UPI003AF225B5